MEDYLEAIHVLSQRKRVVRIKDIARQMGVKMPSVTGALRTLGSRGLVEHERYEDVALTPKGEQIARAIHARHEQLRAFLIEALGLAEGVAGDEACRLEHAVAPETLERLVAFVETAARPESATAEPPRRARARPARIGE
jgi:DtxR family Mn-dependent transcriptional regulator